jgi:hypothetical protein
MFIYCFDEQEKIKLAKQLKLFQETQVGEKRCWVFIINKGSKFNFSEIDKSKCVVSDRINF